MSNATLTTAKMADMVKKGKAKMEGNPQVLKQRVSTMTEFAPWFGILPGTKKQVKKEAVKKEVFEDKALVGQAAAFAD